MVKNHDRHDDISEKDRQLLFEADGFAQIDWYNCQPSYNKKNVEFFLKTSFRERMPYIKTMAGKKILLDLLLKTKKYLKGWKFNK